MAALKTDGERRRRASSATASPRLIDATELVPGDLVELEAGNILPADLRLTEAVRHSRSTSPRSPANRSRSTNSSRACTKPTCRSATASTWPTRARSSTYGRARGLVVATGMQTELGKIAALLSGESGKTPLQKRLARFGRHLALVVLAICVIMFVAGWLRGEPPLLMLLTAISLAVAAIPEALPAVVTISLALGAARLVRQNALIRRLPAVETLGSVTYICSDKTGTLTQNQMQVDRVLAAGETRPGLQGIRGLALARTGARHGAVQRRRGRCRRQPDRRPHRDRAARSRAVGRVRQGRAAAVAAARGGAARSIPSAPA